MTTAPKTHALFETVYLTSDVVCFEGICSGCNIYCTLTGPLRSRVCTIRQHCSEADVAQKLPVFGAMQGTAAEARRVLAETDNHDEALRSRAFSVMLQR